jgi:hypothetical protein
VILDPTKPFETEELIRLRIVQRRRLAEFPDWMMPELPALGAASVSNTPVHPARAEMFVRDFIRERIREHKAILEEDVASGGAVGNSAAEVGEFLAAWHVVMSTDEDFQTRETPLAALLSKVRNDQQRTNPSDESKLRAAFALLPVMRELVSLLDLADLLAGDGYRDTRVKRVS